MTATLTYTLGKFVWRELFTSDPAGAKRFYTGLFGWNTAEMPLPGSENEVYTMWGPGDKQLAGMMDLAHIPNNEHIPPHWSSYVSVADVPQALDKALALGGKQLVGCQEIPGVGDFAVIQDPQGAVVNLFRSYRGDGEDAMPQGAEFCWESLTTTDAAAAIDFYTQVVGWGVVDDGPAKIFTRDGGEKYVASIAEVPQGVPPHWMTYVAVEDLAATNAKAEALGGKVIEPLIEVPGYGKFAVLQDPQGAYLATFQADMG